MERFIFASCCLSYLLFVVNLCSYQIKKILYHCINTDNISFYSRNYPLQQQTEKSNATPSGSMGLGIASAILFNCKDNIPRIHLQKDKLDRLENVIYRDIYWSYILIQFCIVLTVQLKAIINIIRGGKSGK